jgi:hypothetical protein
VFSPSSSFVPCNVVNFSSLLMKHMHWHVLKKRIEDLVFCIRIPSRKMSHVLQFSLKNSTSLIGSIWNHGGFPKALICCYLGATVSEKQIFFKSQI